MSQGSRAFKTLLFANRCGCGMLFIPKYRWSLMYAVRCTQTWRFGPNQGVSCSQSPESKRKSTGNHSRIEASCKILTVTIYIFLHIYIYTCMYKYYICTVHVYVYNIEIYIYTYVIVYTLLISYLCICTSVYCTFKPMLILVASL